MIRKDNIVKIILVIVLILGAIILLLNNKIKTNENSNKNLNEVNSFNTEYIQNEENIVNPYVEKLEDGQIKNNSPELKEEKKFRQINISNIEFVYNPGNKMTTITADLSNTGTEEQIQEIVALKIIGQNGEEIVTIDALIPNIKVGETRILRCSATANLSNATNFEILEK